MDENLKDKVKEVITGNFTQEYLAMKGYNYDLLEKDNILSALNADKEDTVLDAGCGDGRLTLELANKVKEAYAVDFSGVAVKALSDKIKEKNITNVKVFPNDLTESLPEHFPLFDKALSVQVFQHIPTMELKQKALQNIFNKLKPGGKFIFFVFNGSRLMARIKREKRERISPDYGWKYYYFFTAKELLSMFEKTGFKNISVYGSHNFPGRVYTYPFYPAIRLLDKSISKTRLSRFLGIYLIAAGCKGQP